ncbi:hypothetical protein GCM10009582_29930 [Arthrobacter flavus]
MIASWIRGSSGEELVVARNGGQWARVRWQACDNGGRVGQSALREAKNVPFTGSWTRDEGCFAYRCDGFKAFGGKAFGGGSVCFDSDDVGGDRPDCQDRFYAGGDVAGGHGSV